MAKQVQTADSIPKANFKPPPPSEFDMAMLIEDERLDNTGELVTWRTCNNDQWYYLLRQD